MEESRYPLYCSSANIQNYLPLPILDRGGDGGAPGSAFEGWMVFPLTPELADERLALVNGDLVRRAIVGFDLEYPH